MTLLASDQWSRPDSVACPLSDTQVSTFFENGYMVVPDSSTRTEADMVNGAVDRAWEDRSIYNRSRCRRSQERRITRRHTFEASTASLGRARSKLNHLYLYDPGVRSLLLSDRVQAVVRQLLDGTPILFNGLNLEFGSQQRFHKRQRSTCRHARQTRWLFFGSP